MSSFSFIIYQLIEVIFHITRGFSTSSFAGEVKESHLMLTLKKDITTIYPEDFRTIKVN